MDRLTLSRCSILICYARTRWVPGAVIENECQDGRSCGSAAFIATFQLSLSSSP